jgi:hypothetical protein
MDMRFSKVWAVVLLWLGCGLAAQAQLGAYGLFSATGLSGIQCYDSQGKCSSGGGKVNLTGLSGGLYYDFKTVGPVRLGVDFRGGAGHSNKSATSSAGGKDATGQQDFLAGVRGSIHTPISWLRPYAQVSAGWVHSDATEPFGTTTNGVVGGPRLYDNFVAYEGFVGADINVLPMLDLRAIELGIGNMNRFGTGSGSSSAGIKSIGVGVVLHLPSK